MTTSTRNGTFPADARSAAELYLLRGLAPIPLPPRSKDPGYADWQRLRLTPAALDEHFPADEARNVGVLNGAPSGNATDVDLDCPQAVAAAAALLPATGWVFGRASAPRSHWIYLTDQPLNTAQETFTDLDGIMLVELRGTGGLTVFPPSTHKDTGERIGWHQFADPAAVTLADLQTAVRAVAAVALLARHWPAKGTRQIAFLALIGGLLRAGWPQDRVERFIEALASATHDDEPRKRVQAVVATVGKLGQDRKATGWPKLEQLIGPAGKEVVAVARRWLGMAPTPASAAKRLRVIEPYRPFPVEALPAPIAEYVRQGALALGCDPAYLALPALAAAAAVIGNTRTIRLKRGWDEPSVVWSAVVGDSGTLKSPAYLRAVAYLFQLQRRLMLEFKEAARQYEADLEAHKEAKRAAKEEGTDPGDPPAEPVLKRVVCSDTTIEKLAEILEDNPRGTLTARDELAGWLGSFGRYKGRQGGTDLPNWLEMFRAGTVIVDRKTADRQTLFIPRAAVSVTGGIQPGVLARALTTEFLDAGLAARLLMAMPPKLPKAWTDAEVDPDVEWAYQAALDRLLALDFDGRGDEKVPHALALAPDAKAAWVAFYNAWAREQAAAEGELAAAFSKLEGYAARFALIHHVVTLTGLDCIDTEHPVGVRSVEAGVALCRWFAAEARRIYAILSESDEERDARRLVEFVRARGGRITVRGLMRANCRRYPDATTAEAALAALVDAGLARWVERPAKKKGKPIKTLELCVTHDTHDTDGGDGDEDGPDDPPDTHPGGGCGLGPVSPDDTGCGGVTPDPDNPVMRVMRHAPGQGGVLPDGDGTPGRAAPAGDSAEAVMRPVAAPAYVLVTDQAGLGMVAAALDNTGLVGLDLETTGLDPRADRVRLLSVACDTVDGGTVCYLVDCFAVDPAPLRDALADKELVLHNAAFDLAFLARLGFTPAGKVRDTMLLAQLLTAGAADRVTLAACCRRWLGRDLDKAEQLSDWAGDLTDAQLAYAAADVAVLAPLVKALAADVKTA
ncbi:MAG TPA: DUF3987 domain-containing protein, partial [Gemmataceae bacterium]